MKINVNCPPRGLFIGRETENVARTLAVDFSAWAAEHGHGTLQVLLQRPGDATPYPVTLTVDGTVATWRPSETDLAEAGTGAVQLVYTTAAGVREKTQIIPVMVEPSLGVESDPPEGWTSWLDQLTDLAAETEQHAADAAESAENAAASAAGALQSATDAGSAKDAAVAAAEAAAASASHYPQIVGGVWYVWSPTAGEYISTGIDAQGEDGVSPSVEITAIQGGHRVVITDADGPHTFDVLDGVTPDMSAYRTAADQDEIDDAQDEELNNLKSALNTKAGILRDTASGAIASFVPDSTVPDLLGLDVHLEPIQDLHGYEYPWPAGGGANQWDEQWEVGGLTSGGSKNYNLTSRIVSKNYIPVLPSTQYYFLGSNGFNRIMSFYDANKTFLSTQFGNGLFTTPQDAAYALFSSTNDGYGAVYNNDIAINYPATVTTYSPYSNICPISGRESVEVEAAGKNLFDESQKSMLACYADDGAAQTRRGVKLWLPAGTYTIKATRAAEGNGFIYCNIVNKDGSYAEFRYFIAGVGSTLPVTRTFTLTEGQSFILFDQQASAESSVDKMAYYHYMIVSGSTGADYEPYVGTTHTIQLGDTVYGGTLDVTNGTLTVDRAMVTLDGSSDEYWTLQSVNSYGIANFYTTVDHYPAANYRTACNMLSPQTSGIATTETEGYYVHQNGSTVYIRISSTRASTNEALRTWLAQNNIQLVYELATPIVITLDPVTIATIANQTNNVWADAGDVTVEYAADLKTYIDQKIAAAVAAMS